MSGFYISQTANMVIVQRRIHKLQNRIKEFLISEGAGQVGFCKAGDNSFSLPYAISYTIPLSNAVIDEIDNAPTHTYFHHYRTVNAYIDRLSLKCGLMLAENGYKYVSVPASQSVNGMQGIYSHKYAAVTSGLGSIGKSGLFISDKNGPRVRLGTILTDCSFDVADIIPKSKCGDCNICAKSCPALAITGKEWSPNCKREDIIDARACSDFMKREFQKIGRGAVCGICIKVCPFGTNNKKEEI